MACDVCCDQAALCDRCRAMQWSWLQGVAACRGAYWAESVVRRLGSKRLEHHWPKFEESARVRELALRRVHDLGRDPVLLERFARVCAEAAREHYDQLIERAARHSGSRSGDSHVEDLLSSLTRDLLRHVANGVRLAFEGSDGLGHLGQKQMTLLGFRDSRAGRGLRNTCGRQQNPSDYDVLMPFTGYAGYPNNHVAVQF